jgi:SNF2 family DNA or RNA helicase
MSQSRAARTHPVGSRVHQPVATSIPRQVQSSSIPVEKQIPQHLQPVIPEAFAYQREDGYQPHKVQPQTPQTPHQTPISKVGQNKTKDAVASTKMKFKSDTKDYGNVILDQTSPKLDVHSEIRLFPHQQALTAKMIEMESNSQGNHFIGVLKDPPGSGKSYPLLALMLQEKRQLGRTQNLLVIPHNIHKQWCQYISDFSHELQAVSLMYYGDIMSLFYDVRVLVAYDIIITTSTFYDMVTTTMMSIGASFNRVVLDEIDSIAFFTLSRIPAKSIWLVSASADLTNSGVYKDYAKRNGITCDPLFIQRSINLPPPLVERHRCYNEYVQIMQHGGILSSDEMKCVYAMDFTPFKFSHLRNENAVMTAKQLLSAKFRNDSLGLNSIKESIELLKEGSKYRSNLSQHLTHQLTTKKRFEDSVNRIVELTKDHLCTFCCEKWNSAEMRHRERVSTKCCRVPFCSECLKNWVSQEGFCPTCTNSAAPNDLEFPTAGDRESKGEDQIEDKQTEPRLDKLDRFEQILDNETKRTNFRILIFSDMTGTFLKIHDMLKKRGLAYAEIEGNQYTMDKAITDYKSGKRPILLVDSESYGAGMNMEMTTSVIITHKTEREHQIVGRAQRLGRTDRLHVHHLVYHNE